MFVLSFIFYYLIYLFIINFELDITSNYDINEYQDLDLDTHIDDELDLNFLSLDFAYQFESQPVLINKADSARDLISAISQEGSTNPYGGENSLDKAIRFKRRVIESFREKYGNPNMSLPDVGSAPYFYHTSAGNSDGMYILEIIEEPLAQRFQIYLLFRPIDLLEPILEDYYSKEFNSMPGLQTPTSNYNNSIDMPNGIPIQFDPNWPVELKKKFLFAQECHRRSISETNVLNSYNFKQDSTDMYRNMYREALEKKKTYSFNRDLAISDIQRTNGNIK